MRKHNPVKKIAFTLLLIVLLPALGYTVYEFNSLNAKEEVVGEIYRQQLETILFSINQYCSDVVRNWAATLDMIYVENRNVALKKKVQQFLNHNKAIQAIFLANIEAKKMQMFSASAAEEKLEEMEKNFLLLLESEFELLERLEGSQRVGEREIATLVLSETAIRKKQGVILLFKLDEFKQKDGFKFAGIILDPSDFIKEALSPRLKELAENRFIMAVFHYDEELFIYPMDAFKPGHSFGQKKEIWLFPYFYLGIRSQGQTIEEFTRSRLYRSLILLLLLDIALIAGGWFVYKNIQREIELAQMKSDFVSNISHELRTPLSLIRMFSETLELNRVKSEFKRKEYCQIISQEADRLTHLVNNILNFSKIEAGKREYHFYEVNLNEVVRKVLESYQFHFQNEEFQLKVELDSQLPCIYADNEAMSATLINLIDNSVKYSETEKFVRIKTGQENGSVFLEVSDHGIGISLDLQKKIFEKFYRVSSALVHNTKGSGLGLSLVKHIVDAHGGQISVDSKPGKGSRFRLLFPRKTEALLEKLNLEGERLI